MDIVIESTQYFEKDIAQLAPKDQKPVIQGINSFASLWPNKKDDAYHQLEHLPWPSLPNGYESSLYQLRLPGQLSVILAIDEDLLFQQIILTIFRVFQVSDFPTAYQSIAESLYQ